MLTYHREKNKNVKDNYFYKFYSKETDLATGEIKETEKPFMIEVSSFNLELKGNLVLKNQEDLEVFASAIGTAWKDLDDFKIKEEYYRKVLVENSSNEIN